MRWSFFVLKHYPELKNYKKRLLKFSNPELKNYKKRNPQILKFGIKNRASRNIETTSQILKFGIKKSLLDDLETLSAQRLDYVNAFGEGGGIDGTLVGSHLAAIQVVDVASRLLVGIDSLDAVSDVLEVETLDVGGSVRTFKVLCGKDEIVLFEFSLRLIAQSELKEFAALEFYHDVSLNVFGKGRHYPCDGKEKRKDVLFHNVDIFY